MQVLGITSPNDVAAAATQYMALVHAATQPEDPSSMNISMNQVTAAVNLINLYQALNSAVAQGQAAVGAYAAFGGRGRAMHGLGYFGRAAVSRTHLPKLPLPGSVLSALQFMRQLQAIVKTARKMPKHAKHVAVKTPKHVPAKKLRGLDDFSSTEKIALAGVAVFAAWWLLKKR
jgi:hypothetical protein